MDKHCIKACPIFGTPNFWRLNGFPVISACRCWLTSIYINKIGRQPSIGRSWAPMEWSTEYGLKWFNHVSPIFLTSNWVDTWLYLFPRRCLFLSRTFRLGHCLVFGNWFISCTNFIQAWQRLGHDLGPSCCVLGMHRTFGSILFGLWKNT